MRRCIACVFAIYGKQGVIESDPYTVVMNGSQTRNEYRIKQRSWSQCRGLILSHPGSHIAYVGRLLLIFKYRIARLWKEPARKYLDEQKVAVYALLPTMEGANYDLLSQALDEMKAHYVEQPRRFAEHILWFNTLLRRTDTVSLEDKERIGEKMSNIESLLDENPFVQKRRAEGYAEGEARGEAKGRAEGLQFAIMTSIENRFPPLVESVKEKVTHIQQPDKLQLMLKLTFTVPDEKTLQTIIDALAA